MDKVIYFIRHGQTDYNKNNIVQGSGVDSEINEVGRLQAQQFYDYYNKEETFDLIIHSALKRTKQTISPWLQSDMRVISDRRINEMSWGDQEGKPGTPELGQMYKDMIAQWSKGKFEVGMPNGESATELRNRLSDFVHELRKRKEKRILVCSHGRALRCLICILNNQHLKEMESYRISNVGLYIVKQRNDSFQMITENSTDHRTPLPKGLN